MKTEFDNLICLGKTKTNKKFANKHVSLLINIHSPKLQSAPLTQLRSCYEINYVQLLNPHIQRHNL